MRRRSADTGELARVLASLPDLPLEALKHRWQELFRGDPPLRLGRTLMTRAIAHRLQENALGGLRPSVLRQLARAAECLAAGKPVAAPATTVKPGTRLLREWQGITHEVIVLEDGVRYRGETFRSLSEVARIITGARWSGPRFFGLKESRT